METKDVCKTVKNAFGNTCYSSLLMETVDMDQLRALLNTVINLWVL
jgi:hypothetical protein